MHLSAQYFHAFLFLLYHRNTKGSSLYVVFKCPPGYKIQNWLCTNLSNHTAKGLSKVIPPQADNKSSSHLSPVATHDA